MSLTRMTALSFLSCLLFTACIADTSDSANLETHEAESVGSAQQAVECCGGSSTWGKTYDSEPTNDQYTTGLAVDALDNALLTGFTERGMNFGGGPLGLNQGGVMPFVAKVSPTGAHVWSKVFATPYGHAQARAIAADGLDVLVAGRFFGPMDAGGGLMHSSPPYDITGDDAFVVRLSAGGGHIWSKRIGNNGAQRANAVAADKTGNVFLAGEFDGTIDFGGGATLTATGAPDAFIAKLNPSGGHLWSTAFRGTGAGRRLPATLAVDPNGDVIVAGLFEGNITFSDPAACGTAPSGPFPGVGIEDIFVAKLNGQTGCTMWTKRFGSVSEDQAVSLATRADGSIVFVGSAGHDIDFGGGLLSPNGRDVVVVKLSSAGNHLASTLFTGNVNQLGLGVAIDPAGDVLMTGSYENSITIPGLPLLPATGLKDGFVAKLNGNTLEGMSQRSLHMVTNPNAINNHKPVGIAPLGCGDALVAGSFRGSIDFGAGPVESPNTFDLFLTRLHP